MRIDKCCPRVRLPGGERKWRKMARLAHFDGTVRIRPFTSRASMGPNRWELGEFHPKRGIRVRVIHGHGLNPRIGAYSPLNTYGHELGHAILRASGKPWTSASFRNDTEQARNPVERACDRYSRLLQAME